MSSFLTDTQAQTGLEPWVNATTVAAHLGFKSDHIRRMARAHLLPGVQVQNGAKAHWRFKLSEVDAFLAAERRRASTVNVTMNEPTNFASIVSALNNRAVA